MVKPADELGLPKEHIAIVDDDWNPVDDAADLLCRPIWLLRQGLCVQGVDPSEAHREWFRVGRWRRDRISRFGRHHSATGPVSAICEEVREPTDELYREWKAVVRVRSDHEITATSHPRQPSIPQVREHASADSASHFRLRGSGQIGQGPRIIDRIKAICGPWWEKRARRLEEQDVGTTDSVTP